jgi:hypothetical protein
VPAEGDEVVGEDGGLEKAFVAVLAFVMAAAADLPPVW